jgi:FAD/FMN-containing dehydrogenase
MPTRVRRRQVIGAVAASVVAAFDPATGSWLSSAEAHSGAAPVPELDGELVFDEAALAEAADDFGHIVHHRPWAVLRPGSARDVQRMVRFVNEHGLTICMRGQAHSTQGQAQALGGVVIDSRTLATIESVGPAGARVGPGTRWIDLLSLALEQGLTPPVLTDFIELSVGGTLSVGGIGGATHRHGLQVDNVLELEVVTGRGELVTCSPKRRAALFESVLGGLGQFAIIVGATVKLVQAETNARVYRLFYSDIEAFVRDQQRAIDGRFDYLEGQVLALPEGGYQFMLEAASYYTPPALPDDAALLAGLSPITGATVIEEHTYFDWSNRLAPLIAALRAAGQFDVPHPWIDVFVPARAAAGYAQSVLAELTPEDTGGGPMLFYAFDRTKLRRPFVAMPDARVAFIFDVLRFAPNDPAVVQAMLAQNRVFFERARKSGGKRYAASSLSFSFADWIEHFGASFPAFAARKARFDPNGVLTPGQGIFPRRSG